MIQDVYMKVNDNSDIEEVKQSILKSLSDFERVRFIFDATVGSVSIPSMKKLKLVFDENRSLVEQKVEETCIILTGELKKKVVRFFLNSVNKIRPVRIL